MKLLHKILTKKGNVDMNCRNIHYNSTYLVIALFFFTFNTLITTV